MIYNTGYSTNVNLQLHSVGTNINLYLILVQQMSYLSCLFLNTTPTLVSEQNKPKSKI